MGNEGTTRPLRSKARRAAASPPCTALVVRGTRPRPAKPKSRQMAGLTRPRQHGQHTQRARAAAPQPQPPPHGRHGHTAQLALAGLGGLQSDGSCEGGVRATAACWQGRRC